MKPLSKTRDTYTGSFVARRRRKRARAAIAIATVLCAVTATCLVLWRSGFFSRFEDSRPVAKADILEAWGSGRIADVRAMALQSLAASPLDAFYLAFRGFSAYYQSVELPEGEERTALTDETIVSLRKALAIGGSPPRSRAEYILGKAYYGKGRAYYDLAVKYLESSIAAGYASTDGREYLAVAYAGQGELGKAVENFDAALAHSRTEMLLLAAAKANVEAGDDEKAEALLAEALALGDDALARHQSMLLLGDIRRARGDFEGAAKQLLQALETDPDSAEAHYRLGLVYADTGDGVKARAEWRKA
ncbi:MAG: tetratricopeptide repeat protein, partial [Spirochaetaceae bacterium]|nr:tetratricopeptide repeat protein [Spirochaetaceae bacterium]